MRGKTITRTAVLAPLALFTGVAMSASCSSGGSATSTEGSSSSSSSSGNPDGGPDLFKADPPAVYVAKVKNLLVGLPPTDAEVQQVAADPTQLATLIAGWQKLPQYPLKMKVFFEQAFQQTQITAADFVTLVPKNGISVGLAVPYLVQNIVESFARTVLMMNASGQPFTDTMTTTTVMMTPPLMELYAFLDKYYVDDDGNITDTFKQDFPGVSIEQGSMFTSVTQTDAATPGNGGFMKWYDTSPPGLTYNAPAQMPCNGVDPIVYAGSYSTLQWILYGGVDNHQEGGVGCGAHVGTYFGQFTMADFGETAWKPVTLRAPNGNEPTTSFYDIPTLRTASELVLKTPRPGFFSTPAFFANWPTNQSNQMRVTTNQSLIVATGKQVDGTDKTPMSLATAVAAGLDEEHAAPPDCENCHKLLDPTRAVLTNSWNYSYYQQQTQADLAQKGLFAFEGVTKTASGVAGYGNLLATHPDFPAAWVQKLCYYANSSPCQTDDPEFQRIVSDFVKSNYQWDSLVKEIFSSPLTTNATPTATTALAEVVSVSRRDHLCAALEYRLGLTDPCGLSVLTTAGKPTTIDQIAGGLPSDGYGRGATIPVLPNTPTLFYRAGVENICEAIAGMVIDPKAGTLPAGATSWQSTAPAAAIADFVSLIMAITPSDPRSSEVQSILMAHYNAALASPPTPPSTKKISTTQALESTFVAACLSPSFVGIGM